MIEYVSFNYAPIAQLDRVTDYESVGRRFESCWARQYKNKQLAKSKYLSPSFKSS